MKQQAKTKRVRLLIVVAIAVVAMVIIGVMAGIKWKHDHRYDGYCVAPNDALANKNTASKRCF
jgi:flagellar basal body-associated protein FliL